MGYQRWVERLGSTKPRVRVPAAHPSSTPPERVLNSQAFVLYALDPEPFTIVPGDGIEHLRGRMRRR